MSKITITLLEQASEVPNYGVSGFIAQLVCAREIYYISQLSQISWFLQFSHSRSLNA